MFPLRISLSYGHFVEKLLSCAALTTLGSSPGFSDTLYFNGDILKMDGPEPVNAEAVVEKRAKTRLSGSSLRLKSRTPLPFYMVLLTKLCCRSSSIHMAIS